MLPLAFPVNLIESSHAHPLFIFMQEGSAFFDETFYQVASSRTQPLEEEGCTPWTEEVQNYRKQPLFKSRRHSLRPQQRRYTSQLDAPSPKLPPREETPREYMLPSSSVTIHYDIDPSPIKQNNTDKPTKVKLPSLSSRRAGLPMQRSVEIDKQANWGLLGQNKRCSLRRYAPKWRYEDNPPQFQIYKRSLIAARKFVLNAINNPEGTLQYLRQL